MWFGVGKELGENLGAVAFFTMATGRSFESKVELRRQRWSAPVAIKSRFIASPSVEITPRKQCIVSYVQTEQVCYSRLPVTVSIARHGCSIKKQQEQTVFFKIE